MSAHPVRASGLYVNLPVRDLAASKAFFAALGFPGDPRFTDDSAACVQLGGEQLCVMLLTYEKFAGFAPNPIADATRSTQVLNCLSLGSRAEVDELVRRAVAAGGRTYDDAKDHGFMYGHGFQDLDGHVWELVAMDLEAFERMRAGSAS